MKKILTNKINLFLILILVVAAFLRLYRVADYMTFLGDEGRDALVVYNILHGNLTLLGPTASVGGFFLGPIYYYFMAPFVWLFNYHPAGAAIMVGLFGTLTVWFVYKLGKEFFDVTTGIIAAILYTISPLVIAYSRSSWNPNLMPIFTIFTLYSLYNALQKKSTKLFLLSGFLFGILMQLHYLATFVGVIMFIYIWLFAYFSSQLTVKKITVIIKQLLTVFLGFLFGWSPFLLFEIRHGFPNIRSIFNFVFHSGDTGSNGRFISIIWDVFYRLYGRLITNYPPPEQISQQTHPDIAWWFYPTLFLALLSSGLLIIRLIKSYTSNKETFLKTLLISLWFFVGILFFGFYKKMIYDYYFGFLFPLSFLFVGYLFSTIFSPSKEYVFLHKIYKNIVFNIAGKIIAVSTILLLVYVNIQGMPFKYPPNRQYEQVKKISDFILEKANGKPFNFALITGGNSDFAYRYFFVVAGHEPVTIENSVIDPERKTVTDQLFVICESLPCSPLGHSLWEIAGFGRADVAAKWDVSVVQVWKLVHYKGKTTD
jgi:4-amino-4-deoxy-L-arabinose transferase-like glycosyltransferase